MVYELNSNGVSFDRGNHRNAIKFYSDSARTHAHQFNLIMARGGTFKMARKRDPHMHLESIRGLNGICTITVTQTSKASVV